MAGGMGSKRGSWGPMTERIHRADERLDGQPLPAEPPVPKHLKHVYVTGSHGRLPGLLLDWRQLDTGDWEGRVARVVLADDGAWHLVEEWLPAGLLDPV